MTLATNTSKDVFSSNGHDELHGSGTIGLIAIDGWSEIAATGMRAWTNDEDAQRASVTFQGALASASDVGKYIDLYLRPINVINSTDDDQPPNDEFKHIHVGSFPMDQDTAQQSTIDIILPNFKTSSEYEPFINNKSGQELSAGWECWIAPKGTGPVPA